MRFTLSLVLLAAVSCTRPPLPEPSAPQVAPNAPPDVPINAVDSAGTNQLFTLMEPCIMVAQHTYADAKRRYVAGLPHDQSFFVTTRLQDVQGRREQVFVAVNRIERDTVWGRIWNELRTVRGFATGQTVAVPEAEVIDWTITHPDGTEEGNHLGYLIDELRAGRHPICQS